MSDGVERFLLVNPDGSQFGPADVPTLKAWAVEGRIPLGARLRPVAGGEEIIASTHPALAAHLSVPPFATGAPPLVGAAAASRNDALSTLIPTSNPPALIGYYLGVFGLIPCLGLPLAVAALVCGIIGFARARQHPESKGLAHAITAIVLGTLVMIGHFVVIGVMRLGMGA